MKVRSSKDFPFIIFQFSFVIADDFVIDEAYVPMENEKCEMENGKSAAQLPL